MKTAPADVTGSRTTDPLPPQSVGGGWRARLLLVFAAAATGLFAFPGPAAASDKARIQVRAQVLAMFRLVPVAHPTQLEIAPADIQRGYVDVPGASEFHLSSNTRLPFNVGVGFDPSLLSRVTVRVMDDEVTAEVPGASGLVRNPDVGPRHIRVTYRVFVQRTARPGTYPWPVSLVFSTSV